MVSASVEFSGVDLSIIEIPAEHQTLHPISAISIVFRIIDYMIHSLIQRDLGEFSQIILIRTIEREIGYAEIMEGADELVFHRFLEADIIRDVVIEQLVDVKSIGSVRSRSHPQKERRFEVTEYLLICGSTYMMDFVNENIIEKILRNSVEDVILGQSLYGCEDSIGIKIVADNVVLLNGFCTFHHLFEAFHALVEDRKPVDYVEELF